MCQQTSVNYPTSPCWAMLPAAPGHSRHWEFLSPSTLKTLLSPPPALLYSVQMRDCLQLLQSSSAPLAARNRASGIPCKGSHAGDSSVTPRGKREAGHRESELECRSLLLGQSHMKDKNSSAKDIVAMLQCSIPAIVVLDAEFPALRKTIQATSREEAKKIKRNWPVKPLNFSSTIIRLYKSRDSTVIILGLKQWCLRIDISNLPLKILTWLQSPPCHIQPKQMSKQIQF